MVALPLLASLLIQGHNPAGAVKTVASVEKLMTDLGVKGPLRTAEIGEYHQGSQRTGWHMKTSSHSGDIYNVYVGEVDGRIEITLDKILRKVTPTDQLPVDSPLFSNFADHILDQLSKRFELGQPSLMLTPINAAHLSVPVLNGGRPYWGRGMDGDEVAQLKVWFQPDLDLVMQIIQPAGIISVNVKDPEIGLDAAKAAAQRALVDQGGKQVQGSRLMPYQTELTGNWKLINHREFLDKVARLAWSFEFREKVRPPEERTAISRRIFVGGEAAFQRAVGEVVIDAQTGAYLSHDVRMESPGQRLLFSPPTKIGKYLVTDRTHKPKSEVQESPPDPSLAPYRI